MCKTESKTTLFCAFYTKWVGEFLQLAQLTIGGLYVIIILQEKLENIANACNARRVFSVLEIEADLFIGRYSMSYNNVKYPQGLLCLLENGIIITEIYNQRRLSQ